METIVKKLGNGLPVLVTVMPGATTVSVAVMVRAGSRYETRKQQGGSHFLEHLFFKGGRDYPTAYDVSLAIERVGGALNAATGEEVVGYFVKVGRTYAPIAFSVLADMLLYAKLREEDIELERKVIIEELRQAQDDPYDTAMRNWQKLIFGRNSLALDPGGTMKSVGKLRRSDLLDIRTRLYTAERIVISVAGNIEPDEALKFAKPLEVIPSGARLSGRKRDSRICGTPQPNSEIISLRQKNLKQIHLVVGGLGPAGFGKEAKDAVNLTLGIDILAGGMSSRLFQRIREQEALVYDIGGYVQEYSDTGFWCVGTSTRPQNLARLLLVLREEIARFLTLDVTDDEFAGAKSSALGRLLLKFENTLVTARKAGLEYLLGGEISNLIMQGQREIEEVTKESLKEVIARYCAPQNLRLSVVGAPNETSEEILKIFFASS